MISQHCTKNSESTMLANHSTNLKHNFDFSNPKILDKEHNLEKKINLRNDRNFKQQKFD